MNDPKYDKAPARKIGVSNLIDAVTGEKYDGSRVALSVAEVSKNNIYLLKEILIKLDSIDKNLRIMNEIGFDKEI